jgi:hypothetical protein
MVLQHKEKEIRTIRKIQYKPKLHKKHEEL